MARLLDKTRYLALIGVVSLLVGALAAFGWAAVKAFDVVKLIIATAAKDSSIPVALIELMDGFLLATALFVFAVSMYELFIGHLNLPDWMLAHNLYELKAKLSGVIILVMAVKFVERLVEWKDPQGTVLFGISVAVVSGTLIALTRFNLGSSD